MLCALFFALMSRVSAQAPPDETVTIIMSQDVVAVRDVDGKARFLPVTKIEPCPEVTECPPCQDITPLLAAIDTMEAAPSMKTAVAVIDERKKLQ